MKPVSKQIAVMNLLEIDGIRFYSEHLAQFSLGNGGWASALCPFHNDHHPSFAVNVYGGAYICRACGVRGPSFVSFVMALEDVSFKKGLRYLENYHG